MGQTDDGSTAMLLAVLGDEVTGAEAARLLEMSGGDVNVAIALYFDGGLNGTAAVGGADDESVEEDGAPAPTPADTEQIFPVSAHEPQDPSGTQGADHSSGRGEDGDDDAGPSTPPATAVPEARLGRSSSLPGPGDPGPDVRPGGGMQRPKGGSLRQPNSSDDEEDTVLVWHTDALPQPPPSGGQRSRALVRPGTAPVSRHAGEDMRDVRSKKEAMRCVVGSEVEDNILEHLLRSNAMNVQAAIEAYFDVGNAGGLDLIGAQSPFSVQTEMMEAGGRQQRGAEGPQRERPQREASHRSAAGPSRSASSRSRSPEGSDEGPRKPFEDLCNMIGNGVQPNALAPLMVETEGDVAKALDLYMKKYHGPGCSPPPKDDADRTPESYYLRPDKPVQVICNVYDLCWGQDKNGKKNKTNSGLTGMGLGIYHSGIEVYGREVSFGYSDDGSTGVFEVPPRCAAGVMPNITFKEGVVMGTLNRSRFEVDHLLERLAQKYQGDLYDLVRRNCNHFANELCICLVGKKIPSYINRPANMGRVLLNTFQVPAMAFGKIVEGVKGAGKKKDSNEVVVAAPTAAAAMAASGGVSSSQLRDLPPTSAGNPRERSGSRAHA